jgi:hypothetical protein
MAQRTSRAGTPARSLFQTTKDRHPSRSKISSRQHAGEAARATRLLLAHFFWHDLQLKFLRMPENG